MTQPTSRTLYRKRLAKRMKDARKRQGLTQSQMADILGIELEAYKKSEQRGALWADYIEPFALAVKECPLFMLTGRREAANSPSSATLPAKRRTS